MNQIRICTCYVALTDVTYMRQVVITELVFPNIFQLIPSGSVVGVNYRPKWLFSQSVAIKVAEFFSVMYSVTAAGMFGAATYGWLINVWYSYSWT